MPNNRKKKAKSNKAISEAKRLKMEEEAKAKAVAKKRKSIIIISAILAVILAVTGALIFYFSTRVLYSEHLTERDVTGHKLAIVSMEIDGHGDIILLLDATTAPATVQNFVNLVDEGFYNGKTFHRIVKGFMIQGGDPNANGSGGLPEKIKGEFTNNGFYNTLSHKRGTISMARSEDKNSASCQFFICHDDATQLDGSYAAFGYVAEGLEIVDKLANYYKKTDGSETAPEYGMYGGSIKNKSLQPVIKSCKILEEYTSPVTEITYKTEVTPTVPEQKPDASVLYTTRDVSGHDMKQVVMKIKDYGEVKLILDATTAPKTVENFIKLASEGFYNGKTFHRIVEGFVIQGGDPKADGTGNTDPITGEFENNGHENDIDHVRGVISMARGGSIFEPEKYYNTGSCQFFICLDDAPNLDGDYAAFGYVISGMNVIDRVVKSYKGNATGSNGAITDKTKQPVIESVTVKY